MAIYRVNLYPERRQRARAARQRLARGTLVAGLSAILAAFLAAQVMSAVILRARVGSLRSEISRLSLRLQQESQASPEAQALVELLQARAGRIDWHPKLAALSRAVGPDLRFTEVRGSLADRARPPRIEIQGQVLHGKDGFDPVSAFIERLRGEESIAADLSGVRLGNLDGAGSSRFVVVCEEPKEKP